MKRILIFLLMCASAQGAQLYYSPFTVNHVLVPSTQTDFPVLISVTDTRLKTIGNGGHVNNANGYDVRPYSDTGLTTALTYELEFYDAAAGTVVMWVKESSLSSSSDTVIYLGYGDTALTTNGSSSSTWDSSYIAVWHLGNGTTLSLADSKGSNTLTNTASVGATTGQIDGAAGSFNGTTQALNTSSTVNLSGAVTATIEMWCDWSAYASDDDLLMETSTNFNSNSNALQINPNNSSVPTGFSVAIHGLSGGYNSSKFTRPASGLKHFVFTFNNDGTTNGHTFAYVNGVAQTMTLDAPGANDGSVLGNFTMYFMARAAGSLFGAGKLDEVRVSSVIRSQDWITTSYNNQNTPTTFAPIGTEVNIGGVPANAGSLNLFFFLP